MNTLLAQTQVPWPESAHWLFGLIGASVALGSVLFTWNQARKAFGRKPPLHEEFEDRQKGLRSEIYHAKNSALKEVEARMEPMAQRIERLEETQAEGNRRWLILQDRIADIAQDMAFIRGKFERRTNDTSAGN